MTDSATHLNALHSYKHIIGETTRDHADHDGSTMGQHEMADHLYGSHGVGRRELNKVLKKGIEDNFQVAASWPEDGNGLSNSDTNGGDVVNFGGIVEPNHTTEDNMIDVEDRMPGRERTARVRFSHNNDLATEDDDLETLYEQDPDAEDPYIGGIKDDTATQERSNGTGWFPRSARVRFAAEEDHDEILEESLPWENQQSDSWDPSYFDDEPTKDQDSPGEKTSHKYASEWGTLDNKNPVIQPAMGDSDKNPTINSSEEGYDYNPNYSTDPTRQDNMMQDLNQAEPHASPSVPSKADYDRGLSSAASKYAETFDGDTDDNTDDFNSKIHEQTTGEDGGKFKTAPTIARVSPGFAIMEGKRVLAESWFTGEQSDLFDRIERLRELLDLSKQALRVADDVRSHEQLVDNQIQAKTQLEELQRTASFYTTPDEDDYLSTIPGVTVASDYFNPTVFGTIDLGSEDPTDSLYYASKSIEDEFNGYDWKSFVTTGAKQFVEELHPHALDSEIAVREAAVSYVHKKTLPILDIEQRAAIIDNFVSNSELTRRALNKQADKRQKASDKYAESFLSDSINDSQRLATKYSHMRNNLTIDLIDSYDPEEMTFLGAVDEFAEGERYATELKKRNWPEFLDHEASRFLDELDPGLYDYPELVIDNAISHIGSRTASINIKRREKIAKGFVDRVYSGLQNINDDQRFTKSSSRLDSEIEGVMSDRYLRDSFESQDISEINWL